jgi:hypothetical protein
VTIDTVFRTLFVKHSLVFDLGIDMISYTNFLTHFPISIAVKISRRKQSKLVDFALNCGLTYLTTESSFSS